MNQPISPERLDEFTDLWEEAFGERLYRTEAIMIATRLVAFYQLISKPLPPDPLKPGEQTDPEAP